MSRLVFLSLSLALVVGLSQAAVADLIPNGDFETSTIHPNGLDGHGNQFYAGKTTGGEAMPLDNVSNWTWGDYNTDPATVLDGLVGSASGWGNFVYGAQSGFVSGTGGWFQGGFEALEDSSNFQVQFYGSAPSIAGLASAYFYVYLDNLDTGKLTFNSSYTLHPAFGTSNLYTSDATAITAGHHTLIFQSRTWTNPATNITSIDNFNVLGVAIASVPEPSCITIVVTGIVGLLAYAWRRRK